MNVNLSKICMVSLYFVIAACSPKTKSIVETKEVDISKIPFSDCDRGVDFNSRQCDRTIEDHTFWLGSRELKFRVGNNLRSSDHVVDVKFAYEFAPPVVAQDDVGRFVRAFYFYNPKAGQFQGYWESGNVHRISHKEIDFEVQNQSCVAQGASASRHKHTFYKRNGHTLQFRQDDPKNELLRLLLLPLFIVETILSELHDSLSIDSASKILNTSVDLKPYKFEIQHLPVHWGCSSQGRFITSRILQI